MELGVILGILGIGRGPKWLRRLVLFVVLLFGAAACLQSFPAAAQTLDPKIVQEALVWMGFYAGPLDGEIGPSSLNAIHSFQKSINHPSADSLSDEEAGVLMRRAVERKTASGFKLLVDPSLGAIAGFPTAYITSRRNAEFGTDYISADQSSFIELRHYNSGSNIEYVYESLRKVLAATSIGYSVLRADWFVISGDTTTKKYYFRFYKVSTGYQGAVMIYDKSQQQKLSPALAMLSLTFQPAAVPEDARIRFLARPVNNSDRCKHLKFTNRPNDFKKYYGRCAA